MTKEEAQELSLKMWENTCASVVYCDRCKYYGIDNCDEVKFYEQGKADAIEEFFHLLESKAFGNRKGLVHWKDIVIAREQMKGELRMEAQTCEYVSESGIGHEKEWLAEHDKQIKDEVIEKFVAECNLNIHDIQMECEDDGIVFLCIEDIREIAKKLKGE